MAETERLGKTLMAERCSSIIPYEQIAGPSRPGPRPGAIQRFKMSVWKFSCERKSDIPLPPAYTFPQAFNYLNSESNSFYLLEHENGNYIQCGGSKQACCVEIRIYENNDSYKHHLVGHVTGSDAPAVIQMSAGVVNVLEREVLSHWEAIELFKQFFAGKELPDGYSLRVVDR